MNSASRIKPIAAAVALMTFVVYLPALRNGFVTWDDDVYVFENYHLLSLNAAFFKWACLAFHTGNWHPLTWISHAIDYAAWRLNPLGHHLSNIVLHAVNTFLVVLLTGSLLESHRDSTPRNEQISFLNQRALLTAAAATGLLFGLHPVHVESVAWVSERKDLLCALFFLLSGITYVKYVGCLQPPVGGGHTSARRKQVQGGNRRSSMNNRQSANAHVPDRYLAKRLYVSSLSFSALALMSKPMAVSLPLVLLILDWHPLGRIRSLKTMRTALVEKLPFIALSLGSSIVTMLAQREGGAMKALASVPLAVRLPVAAKSVLAYLGKMIWPFNLSPYYAYPQKLSILSFEYLAVLVLALGITIACIVLAREQKHWLAVWGYYVVTLVPVLGIVQVGIQAMADRYTYLPGLGPFLLLALGITWLLENTCYRPGKGFAAKIFAASAAVVALVGLSLLTIKQTAIWKDSMTLWNFVIDHSEQKVPFAYVNRGVALEKAGLLEQAIRDYAATIELDPGYSQAYANRGVALGKAGRLDQAMADFKKAIVLDPSSAHAYFNLGSLYQDAGRLAEAIEQYGHAIALDPEDADAYHNRGVALSDSGRSNKALEDYNRAISLNRSFSFAYFNRGNLFLASGDTERARADLRMACDLGYEGGCSALRALP